MKDDRTYLLYIRECIARIEEDVAGGRPAFDSSHTIQDAVTRNLQVLAESTKRLSEVLKAKHPTINWAGIAGFRNLLVHDYFSVDLSVIWQIVMQDIPALKKEVLAILKPPYLTVNNDLQINMKDPGARFPSKHGIEYAVSEVEMWLDAHPTHPRRDDVEVWFERAGENMAKLQTIRHFQAKRTAVEQSSLRGLVRDELYRRMVTYADLDRITDEIVAEILGFEK